MVGPGPQFEGVTWTAQVGPTIGGPCNGYAFSGGGIAFYVSPGPGSDPGQTYAYYSPDGGNWTPIPNNQQITAGGGSLEWSINPPAGGLKFLIGSVG